jgi:UDP-N-acetylmuramyl tripeptide synthase
MEVLEDLMLFGPNRRHPDKTVIELVLKLAAGEETLLDDAARSLQSRLVRALELRGLTLAPDHPLTSAPAASPAEQVAWLIAGTALALQQHAGHRVEYLSLVPVAGENVSCVVFEYEHNDVGDDSMELAFLLLADVEPGLALADPPDEDRHDLHERFNKFMKTARAAVLPRDAQAIIDAAARLDVPCVKLERSPYAGLDGEFRVRPNGLLKLGHACRQQVIDGTFCIYRNQALVSLVHDRAAVYRALSSLGDPLPGLGHGSGPCITAGRAVRAAERIGYPVVIKPLGLRRSAGDTGLALGLKDAAAVRAAAERALGGCRGVAVEAHIPGTTFKVVVANRAVLAVLGLKDGVAVTDVTREAHPSIVELALRIAEKLDTALLTLTLVSTDISCPPGPGGAFVSMNVAPELDAFLAEGGDFPGRKILDDAAEGLIRFLFPDPAKSRIPVIAVTGPNGKTTICALIAKVMQAEGYVTGRAGTTGFFIDDDCLEFNDFSGGSGHHKVLESAEVEFAVLESARGAATGMGFMYDWSDIAVCSNVTEDHLFTRGINSVEEMAGLKLLIMQRARHAVVLNADDPMSAGMLPRLAGRKAWLVSHRRSHDDLLDGFGQDIGCVVVEEIEGLEWMVLHDEGRRLPLVPVNDVPITFEGRLRYNLSNALQAAAACYQQGAAVDSIRAVLEGFQPDHETSPGRMNFYHGLPFTVLVDYAHNVDGFRHLRSFVDSMEVRGRKVISVAIVGRMSDEEIIQLAGSLAGSFDHYICRNYPKLYGREPEEVPALIKRALIQKGIQEERISMTPVQDYVTGALDLCRAGDLLVFLSSTANLHKEWEQITSYRCDEANRTRT